MSRSMLLSALVPAMLLVGCGQDSATVGYDEGCIEGDDDGYKDGYSAGFSCQADKYSGYSVYAEAAGDGPAPDCDDAGCLYYGGWLEGYGSCYDSAYEEGILDGQVDGACQ